MRITPNRYRSKYEEDVCGRLDKAKIPFDYETINLHYQVTEQRKYIPDVILPNGIIIELKGRFTAKDRKKMLLVINQHPDLDIRMVFQNDGWTTKLKKQKYSEWCIKRKIKYCIGKIPKEWLL